MGLKNIIVIIDTFTRYVELFPKQEVTAIAAADALWRHTCRFTAPLELMTYFDIYISVRRGKYKTLVTGAVYNRTGTQQFGKTTTGGFTKYFTIW